MKKREIKVMLFKRQSGQCAYCFVALSFYVPKDHALYPQLEHVHPKARGGKDEVGNYVLSCKHCNSSKGTRDVGAFKRDLANDGTLTLRKVCYYQKSKQ